MPSPLKLAELMDVDAIKDKSSDQISNIWMAYHRDEKKHRIGGLMTAAEYNTLSKNAKESPMFVLPVFKPGGGYLTMAMQWQRPFFLFTTLQEFRK